MKIAPMFHGKRIIHRKKQFDKNVNNEITHSTEESFRVDYFLYIVDQTLYSLKLRFEQFKKYKDTFGFLFDLKKLQTADDNCLKC